MAQFMVVLDATIVNVALPSIQEDLDVAEADLQWIVNSYTLIFGGFLLLGGRAGDLLGRKRLFLAGVVVFTAASFLNGIAQSSEFLIVARGLQGFGAALVAPAALSILTTTFAEGDQRTKAMGVWAGIATGGAAIGLLLGGILTDLFSWPWIFFVNIPVGIAAFVLSLRYVPESRAEGEHRIFDVPGAVTVTAGLISLVYGIVQVQQAGWTSTSTIAFLALAAVLLTAFVFIELRQRAPLVRLDIFRVRTLRAANLAMLLVASGLFAMFFFNTLYVQRVLGFSPLQAGLAFLPVTVGIGIGAGLSQLAVKRMGIRSTSIIGMSIATIGMLILLTTDANGTYLGDVLPGLIPISIGMGLTFVPVTLLATSGMTNEDAGLASGLFNTSQQVGGALGLAILSTIAVDRTSNALGGLPGQPTVVQEGEALVSGFHAAFLGGAVFFAAGIVVMLTLLKSRDVADVDVDRPMTELTA
ncbi:MAG: MFS transporter [Actinobacteria bacterium]|nr:MFS transporter [Actinomycetota bacterium]